MLKEDLEYSKRTISHVIPLSMDFFRLQKASQKKARHKILDLSGLHHDGWLPPLAWSGPFEGSMHDSECMAESDIYGWTHKVDEMVIADKAYRSVRHCPRQETVSSVDDLFDIHVLTYIYM